MIFLLLILFIATSLGALELRVQSINPNQVTIVWDVAPSATSYEIFVNNSYQGAVSNRLYTITDLTSHTEYTVLVRAKIGSTRIDEGEGSFTTSGWEGRYQWINETKKNNRGRAVALDYRVEYTRGQYTIWGLYEGLWHKIFPLVEPWQVGIEYEANGTQAHEVAYRLNAHIFNTSAINPKHWKVLEQRISDHEMILRMETRVGALRYTTFSRYYFTLDRWGNPVIEFTTVEEGISNWAVFSSPNPGEEGVFIARAIR